MVLLGTHPLKPEEAVSLERQLVEAARFARLGEEPIEVGQRIDEHVVGEGLGGGVEAERRDVGMSAA